MSNNENQLAFSSLICFTLPPLRAGSSYFKTVPADASSSEKGRIVRCQPVEMPRC